MSLGFTVSPLPTTVAEVLRQARGQGVARLDAQLLLAHHLRQSRAWLLAHDDAALDAQSAGAVVAHIAQRADGVPLAYLTGQREFHGLRLSVTSEVLVPRPETEALVDWAAALLEPCRAEQPAVADLGTGSGAIALALKAACPWACVTATDTSAAALQLAGANADALGLAIETRLGSWFEPLAGRRFTLLVSNPPYIAGDDPHLGALRHEPRAALTPEGDGLVALQQIARQAREHLEAGGWLLLEHGHDQAEAVAAALFGAGFEAIETRSDLAGLPRLTGGRSPLLQQQR